MQTFTDGKTTWEIVVNVATIKRVRSLVNVDLTKIDEGDPPLGGRLTVDPLLLCDVVFALVKPQADTAGVTDEQFAERMGGDSLRLAFEAFWKELTDFFLKLDRRELAQLATAQLEILRQVVEAAAGAIETYLTAATTSTAGS